MQISSTTRSLVFLPSILMSLFENWKYIWSPNAQYKASKPFAKWILTYNLTSNLSMDQIPVMKISKKTFLYGPIYLSYQNLRNSWSLKKAKFWFMGVEHLTPIKYNVYMHTKQGSGLKLLKKRSVWLWGAKRIILQCLTKSPSIHTICTISFLCYYNLL